jgi:hypothetical protein
LGKKNLPEHPSNVPFLSRLPQIGAFSPLTCEQEIFVPQQEDFRDALSTVHARRAGIIVLVGELLRARYNFYLVKLNVPVQTPL